MNRRPIKIAERWICNQETLADKLGCDLALARDCIDSLAVRGVLKPRARNDGQGDEGEDEDIKPASCQFVFVGLILFENLTLEVYPKYFGNEEEVTLKAFQQIMRVIRKDAKGKPEPIASNEKELAALSHLALMLSILEMYEEYGLYESEKRALHLNGGGSINWERTIAKHDAFISDGMPIYFDFETNETQRISDFITRLHRLAITTCSVFMVETGLADLLGIDTVELSTDMLDDLGDPVFVLHVLQQERSSQFVSWKQRLLDLLIQYFNEDVIYADDEETICLGSTAFHGVWERACSAALGNVADTKLRELALWLPNGQDRNEERALKELIPRPQWYKLRAGEGVPYQNASRLIPDAIIAGEVGGERSFGIFDAKYYNPVFKDAEEGKRKLEGAPGVGDVIKQYLYLSAYTDFIERNRFTRIANVFLVPSLCQKVEKLGWVDFSEVMGLLEGPDGKSVNEVVMFALSAEMVWEHFLDDRVFDDEMIAKLFVEGRRATS